MPQKTSKKKPSASGAKPPTVAAQPRRLPKPQYKSFRLHKRIKPFQPKLPSSYRIMRQSLTIMNTNKQLFGLLLLIYAGLTLILVRGLTGGLDITGIRDTFTTLFDGALGNFLAVSVIYGSLLGTTGSASGVGNYIQPVLMVLVTLATIWALRQAVSKEKVTAKDAFYKGMYPLIPFLLVLGVVCLQLLPLLLGNWIVSLVLSNGIAVTVIEKALWVMLFLLTALLSLYMVSSSLFALLIVTLPDMTPMQALRSARQLVLHRRWVVMRKLILLPIMLLLGSIVIMLPILLFLTAVAEWAYFMLSMFGWLLSLTYLYTLYRKLLHE